MKKKYKWTLFVTGLITLCPSLVGILLWNQLPDVIATHFGTDNVANGWSSKPFAVFGIPLILLGLQLFCFYMVSTDTKKKNINEKMMKKVLWIIPIISCVVCLSCYGIALGMAIDILMVVDIVVGIIFTVCGYVMHGIGQNDTVGIRVPWTLKSEENWNRTHKMASWIWIVAGVLMIIDGFVKTNWLLFVAVGMAALVPIVYSYWLYKKGI
ncbi:MAG: SdpI family protein [Eubacterium sp.]|nr:SdpI family protein [Eubacterium sp.]MDD7210000.1 SdpI family protein [Lachnospiraceae bacterium]MDY5496548.1 SdpI family protein [Anaerobutyricum sp.]